MPKQTAKGAETRRNLLNASLRLFARDGFQKTTMRAIARESGLSLGSAYHYFGSKDELAHELFRTLLDEHRARTWPRLVVGNNLELNIRSVMDSALDVLEPFHEFGPAFIRTVFSGGTAADGDATPSGDARDSPDAALTAVHRAREFAVWRQAVATARPQPPAAIRQDLPELLWLAQRGTLLFWAYDSSPGRTRTRRLIRNAAPLLARLAVLSRLPVVRAILDDVISLVRSTDHAGA